MKKIMVIVGILFTLAVTPVSADVYSWTDENGVRHYGNVDVSADAENVKKAGEIKKDGESRPVGTPQTKARNGQINAFASQMQSDPEIMRIIQSLQNDPAFAKILLDPALMKAAQSGNVGALMANPKILELADHPKVREIGKKLTEKDRGAAKKPETPRP